jgi:hypothetical protein
MRYSLMRKDLHVAHIPVPERPSVTGQFHATNILSKVVKHYNNARPRTDARGIHLYDSQICSGERIP